MPTRTTQTGTTPADVDPLEIAARVTAVLGNFLDAATATLEQVGAELAPVAQASREFLLAGGKRLRPAFCYWGGRGAGAPDSDELVTAAASLELLHACALIHDDVIDGSDMRRGRPAIHRRFAALHRGNKWGGDPDAFGASAAILLGDVCLVWADQLLRECGLAADAIARASPAYAEMRVELMAGQYLDVLAAVAQEPDTAVAAERAFRIARYKSAKYTIERPLHLGGLLCGASPELLSAYTAYGIPLGEAFQLRDDLLGVYGDPALTGKPAGDDLREGKRTVLVTLAEQRARPEQAETLRLLLGNPALDAEGVAVCRSVIAESGALAEVEDLITRRCREARSAVAATAIDERARPALEALAGAVTDRIG